MKKRALINASLVLALAILASTGWWAYSVASGPGRGGNVSAWTLAALAVGGILGAALVLTSSVLLKRQVVARRRARSALRISEIRYRRLFEAAQDGVLLIDPLTQKIIDANPFMSQLLSSSREDILGREARQIGLLQDAAAQEAACRQLQATGYLHYEDLPVQARSGERREVELFGNVYEEDGHSVIQCNIRDITQRKHLERERAALLVREQSAHQEAEAAHAQFRALFESTLLRSRELQELNERLHQSEERLQAANRELDDFATIVSHDLKSPLRIVSMLADQVQSDYAGQLDESGRGLLAQMVRRVARMDRMIQGILLYSRLGRTADNPAPVPLAELVPAVVEDLAPPTHVRVRIAPDLPVVYGDAVRLRQLFQNLIDNALKHSDKQQIEIRVEWADRGSVWEFSVADNGPGIEERHFERIFKIFQTLGPQDHTDSTGVGLALVQRIVECAGGRVWIESRVGEGSTFRFTWAKPARGAHPQPLESLAA